MLNTKQEQAVQYKVSEAKKLLLEAVSIVKTDWNLTFDNKDMSSPDGSAWLNIIGNISDKVLELEQCLEIDMQVAKSFEERLGNTNVNISENT
jgi:hypothetical protein